MSVLSLSLLVLLVRILILLSPIFFAHSTWRMMTRKEVRGLMMQNWRVPCLQNLTRNHDNLNYINQLITLKQTKIAHWPQMESPTLAPNGIAHTGPKWNLWKGLNNLPVIKM